MWNKQKTNKLFSRLTHQQSGTRQLQYGLLKEFREKLQHTAARDTEVCEAKLNRDHIK